MYQKLDQLRNSTNLQCLERDAIFVVEDELEKSISKLHILGRLSLKDEGAWSLKKT